MSHRKCSKSRDGKNPQQLMDTHKHRFQIYKQDFMKRLLRSCSPVQKNKNKEKLVYTKNGENTFERKKESLSPTRKHGNGVPQMSETALPLQGAKVRDFINWKVSLKVFFFFYHSRRECRSKCSGQQRQMHLLFKKARLEDLSRKDLFSHQNYIQADFSFLLKKHL